MNIWSKMMTALRGGFNEAGETIIDSQALRILDQEVRDASEELSRAKDGLSSIIARQKVSEQKAIDFKQRITEHEGYAIKALDKGDEALAMEVAEKIASLEAQLSNEEEAASEFTSSANELKASIAQTERNIARLKQQVDTVKATENVQRAQSAVAQRHSGSDSKLRTAMDSLERIKEKQALNAAQMTAAKELADTQGDTSLQQKLEDAGIAAGPHSAADVLARLKNKK